MEKYSFFNDVNNDRVYFAEDFARHLARYFTNGIFNNSCQILANNDMTVNLSIGSANINGYRYDNDSIKALSIDNADGVLNRIDNVVIRLDLTNRNITTQVIKGTFAENPVAPDLVRNSTTYDLRIAKISIPAGTTTITQDLITDTRLITNDCGNVICAVQTPNTENLFLQLTAEANKVINDAKGTLEEFITNSESSFNTWFATIKSTLDGDTAGNLLNKINDLESKAVIDSNYVHTDNNYSSTDKTKVDSIPVKADNSIFGQFIQTTSEEEALALSTTNPDIFYYWSEE